MANAEHIDILKEGVERWNAWREENKEVWPDLREAKLNGANLARADLSEANLECAQRSGSRNTF